MKVYGDFEVNEGSHYKNLATPTGPIFPLATKGELFYIDDAGSGMDVGLYNFNGTSWIRLSTINDIPTIPPVTSNLPIIREAPIGSVDGVNARFELLDAPLANTEMVFVNGLFVASGSSADYTITGKIITFNFVPAPGDIILVTYYKYVVSTVPIVREIPSGSSNGSNTHFELLNTPIIDKETIYVNGLLMNPGSENDYTISGSTITFNFAPTESDTIFVTYYK
jgi:archaellum component FlaF (FlaF/FlaG flagellin family)